MLRTIKHPHLRPYLQGFKWTTAATPSGTCNIGAGDLTSITRNAAGRVSLVHKTPYSRNGIVVCSPSTSYSAGAYGTYNTDGNGTTDVAACLNAAGSAAEGTGYSLHLNWASDLTDSVSPLQGLLNSARSPRLLAFKIASSGSVTIGGRQGTVSKASSVYTITFANAFGRAPIVVAVPEGTSTQKSCKVDSVTAYNCAISTYDASEAAEDNAFHVFVLGWDSSDEQYQMGRVLQTPQLQPRLLGVQIEGSTGTVSLTVGKTVVSSTDNGTGDYTLTFTKAFQRAPVVIASGKDSRAQIHSATSSACRILTFNATGSAADSDVNVLILGFDSADEK